MATGNEIRDRSLAFSSANDPGITAGDEEIRIVLNQKLKKLYRRVFTLVPSYFGAVSQVNHNGNGWSVPTGSAGVYHIEQASNGAEVHVVPRSEALLVATPPRVFRLGSEYRTVGEAGDPGSGEVLNVFYGRLPTVLTTLEDSLPSEWPVEHEDLLAVEVALYLALKDKARGDYDELETLRDDMLAEFDQTILLAEPSESRFARRR